MHLPWHLRGRNRLTQKAPTGEYQLRVHVIEARGLVGRDADGTCDPVVKVEAFGQTRRTQVKDGDIAPVFDETLFIIEKDVDHVICSGSNRMIRGS